jgi:hypothetical protein
MGQNAEKTARITFRERIVDFHAHLGAARSGVKIRVDESDDTFEFAARHRRSSQDGFLPDADVRQIALIDFGVKPHSRKIAHLEERLAGLDGIGLFT